MGSFTQPVPENVALSALLDRFLPDSGQMFWYDREQPTNWDEDAHEGEDAQDAEYFDQFRYIESTDYIRGYFLIDDDIYFLGGTFEEALLKLEVEGEHLLNNPL